MNEEKYRYKVSDSSSNKKAERVCFDDCNECSGYTKHIQEASQGREEYRTNRDREWDEGEAVFSADLQKVIMQLVMSGLKKAIFCRRIVMFNELFAPLGGIKKDKSTGVLWHEGISGRTGEDLASVFIAFLRKLKNPQDCHKMARWLDNCSAQGKTGGYLQH